MGYTDIIDRSGAEATMPEEVVNAIQTNLDTSNWLFRLARRLPNMARAQARMPILGALAQAYFVNGDTGLKQTTETSWENKYIDAEEIAVIVPIPEAVIADSSYDLWGQVRPQLEIAFNRAIIGAVVFGATPYGQLIPASWTTNIGAAGLVAGATNAGHVASIAGFVDLYEALLGESADGAGDGLLALLEADGFLSTGHAAAVAMRGRYRNVRDKDGQPIFKAGIQEASNYELDGSPIFFPTDGSWDAAQALQISGQWDQLVYAMRQDMTYMISRESVITDAAGKVVVNLFQQDMVALRAVMRLGFALPNPITAMNETAATRYPFAVLTA